MTVLICSAIGALFSISIYLLLSRNLLRFLVGMAILSSSVNILILMAGRLTTYVPPFIDKGDILPDTHLANPLPQALILTAIVIGFGLLVFALVLIRKIWQRIGFVDTNNFRYAERIYKPKIKK